MNEPKNCIRNRFVKWHCLSFRIPIKKNNSYMANWPCYCAAPVQLVKTWTNGLLQHDSFKNFFSEGMQRLFKEAKSGDYRKKIFRVTMATFQSLLRKKCLIGQIWVFEIEFWETLPCIYTVGSQKFWRMCRFRSLPVWLGSCSRIRYAPQLQRGRNESREPHADAEPLPSWLKCIRWGH